VVLGWDLSKPIEPVTYDIRAPPTRYYLSPSFDRFAHRFLFSSLYFALSSPASLLHAVCRFGTSEEYIRFFEPLLFENFQATLCQAYETRDPQLAVLSGLVVDAFEGVGGSSSEENGGWYQLVLRVYSTADRARLSSFESGDVILITQEALGPALPATHLLGIFERPNKAYLCVRVLAPASPERASERERKMFAALRHIARQPEAARDRSKFSAVRLEKPVTDLREFMALQNVGSISLLSSLLQPNGEFCIPFILSFFSVLKFVRFVL
jgi:hypothetical protein